MRALVIFVLIALLRTQAKHHLQVRRHLQQTLDDAHDELTITRQKLQLATKSLPASERRPQIQFTVLMALVPIVFLWLNKGADSPFIVAVCGLLGSIAYMINLSAPYRDELVANKPLISARMIACRTPWWQWVVAILTGVFYAFGAWGVSDPFNLLGLSGSMALLTLPAILNRQQT